MKWLLVLAIILTVIVLFYIRYRRQIETVIKFWRILRQSQIPREPNAGNVLKKPAKDAVLVRCTSCGKWIEEASALGLPGKMYYCSPRCLEQTASL
jgi:hypothetical protein